VIALQLPVGLRMAICLAPSVCFDQGRLLLTRDTEGERLSENSLIQP
jgi:hypothetical protein